MTVCIHCVRGSTPIFWRRSREPRTRVGWLRSTHGCPTRHSSVSGSWTTSKAATACLGQAPFGVAVHGDHVEGRSRWWSGSLPTTCTVTSPPQVAPATAVFACRRRCGPSTGRRCVASVSNPLLAIVRSIDAGESPGGSPARKRHRGRRTLRGERAPAPARSRAWPSCRGKNPHLNPARPDPHRGASRRLRDLSAAGPRVRVSRKSCNSCKFLIVNSLRKQRGVRGESR